MAKMLCLLKDLTIFFKTGDVFLIKNEELKWCINLLHCCNIDFGFWVNAVPYVLANAYELVNVFLQCYVLYLLPYTCISN